MAIPFKRKLRGKTDYRKRLKLLKSGRHRIVVRAGLGSTKVSIVKYADKGDKVELSVSSSNLEKMGWKGGKGNIPSAYLTGYLAGVKAKQKKIGQAILDIGLRSSVKGSRVYAAVAGAIDGGLAIPQNGRNLPEKERLIGAHISKYAETIKGNKEKYESQFGGYIKRNIKPEDIPKHVEEIKNRISK